MGKLTSGTVDGELCHFSDRTGVADAAVAHQHGNTSLHQSHHQDLAGARGSRVASAVDHQHVSGRRDLDRLALGMLRIGEHGDGVEIFARRDVAQREGGASTVALIFLQ